jgi:hypothetical protein
VPQPAEDVEQEPLDAVADAGRPALAVAGDVQDLDLVLDDPLGDVARPGEPLLDAQARPAQLAACLERGAGPGSADVAEPQRGVEVAGIGEGPLRIADRRQFAGAVPVSEVRSRPVLGSGSRVASSRRSGCRTPAPRASRPDRLRSDLRRRSAPAWPGCPPGRAQRPRHPIPRPLVAARPGARQAHRTTHGPKRDVGFSGSRTMRAWRYGR